MRFLAVTYGPFPPADEDPWGRDRRAFAAIRAAGFDAIRLYGMPDRVLLDAAWEAGLRVFGGLRWGQQADFLAEPRLWSAARVDLAGRLREIGGHPALAGVYVGNEIPADLVRWMGPLRVRAALEDLIRTGRELAPEVLFAYASYPSTEYLEVAGADFTALNVFLEEPEAFRAYLRRLRHLAGHRPLVISEFGLDSRRNGVARQAEVLDWALRIAREEQVDGMTLYAWSDRWWNAGALVPDWDFGLLDREGRDKPALEVVRRHAGGWGVAVAEGEAENGDVSVIVCSRNGVDRIAGCLEALRRQRVAAREVIVVDDGSTDGTGERVAREFPEVRLLRLAVGGLSAARNAGAAVAKGAILAFTDDDCEPDGEWLGGLLRGFASGGWAALGGPNLPPPPQGLAQAVVAAAPGAPSHVMLDDLEAEHLPGCNFAVRREAFEAVGGFEVCYHTAGDDVDFCWRLQDAGLWLGFAADAVVWHHPRGSLRGYLRQQVGYGRAEAMLMVRHPQRFSEAGGIRWRGFVYTGGARVVCGGDRIYHGSMGTAGYQSLLLPAPSPREIARPYDGFVARALLGLLRVLQPVLRAWARHRSLRAVWRALPWGWGSAAAAGPPPADAEWAFPAGDGGDHSAFLAEWVARGWRAAGPEDFWDLERAGSRVQFATERGPLGRNRVLIRLWGNPADAPL